MRTRKEIEDSFNGNRVSGPYMDGMNEPVNLNLENIMQNQGLTLEVLLDIRDLLSEEGKTAKAQLCPVCLGSGKISSGLGQTTTVPIERTCHGCGGRGWGSVPEERARVESK